MNTIDTSANGTLAKSTAAKTTATEKTMVRMGLATLSAFAMLAGIVLVSANAKIPIAAGPHKLVNLSGDAIGSSVAVNPSKFGQQSQRIANQLNAEQLKRNALSRLRGLPSYYTKPSSLVASPVVPSPQVQVVDVNTFLLATGISNDSKLPELQMQPWFSEFDSLSFVNIPLDRGLQPADNQSGAFAGVGFPHIETNNRPDSDRYKPYKQLLSFNSNGNGGIVPHIKCMGLSPESVAQRAQKYDQRIYSLAVKYNVSASLVKAVVAKESCYNSKARSHVGAMGLMQLMPETAKWLKVRNPDNPDQNLAAGVRYLAQLRKRFGSNELALAAYNAGPGNVERYDGIPPFAETQNYVHDVMYFYRGYVATTRFVNAQNTI